MNWVNDEDQLRLLAISFFGKHYNSSGPLYALLHTSHGFPEMAQDDRRILDCVLSINETRIALFSMHNYKSPGPNGYSPLFFKS